MLELEEAVARILTVVPPVRPEKVPVENAHGRVLAESVLSPIDLPPFDNSAMDGYAVHSQDILKASAESPVPISLAGKVAAGEVFPGELSANTCVRVFTGSALPSGADSVVMQEDTRTDQNDTNTIHVLEATRPWENVRFKGVDVRAGKQLALAGEVLNAGHVSLLAAAGLTSLSVGHQPTVGLIATGSELQEPGQPLQPGQIYESNRAGLTSLITLAGAKPVPLPIVPDTLEGTKQAISAALSQCDIVVTAGGASVGELDLVKPALAKLGGELEFWKVSIKPGKPFAFGRFKEKLFFGLPGNPVSALVTFLLLVRPALKRWQGSTETQLPEFKAVLAEALSNPGPRRHFMSVRLDRLGAASLSGPQASHLLSSFAGANGLVDVPPGTTLAAGTPVSVQVWGF
jgi:molybdopterin molybdotransferase